MTRRAASIAALAAGFFTSRAAPIAALAAGALLPLALAPFDLWPLMLVSAGTLFWLLQHARSARRACWLGWLFGVGKYGIGTSWVYVSIHVYGSTSPPFAAFLVALFVAAMALFCAAMGCLHWALARPARSAPRAPFAAAAAFAAAWTATEWALTWFLGGFPWLFAGYAFLETALAGLAPLGGVLLVSLGAALTAALTVSAAHAQPLHRRIALLSVPAVLWLAAWGLGGIAWTTPGAWREVALVQGNVPQQHKWDRLRLAEWQARYRQLSAPAWDADLLLWPEAAIPDYLHRTEAFIERIRPPGGADLVHGTVLIELDDEAQPASYNAAASTAGGIYRKHRLVPFGDYLPFEETLDGVIAFFDLPMPRTEPGPRRQPPLRAGGLDLALAICYEIAYPDAVARNAAGADMLATISNDTWFGSSIGPLQHAQMARMRALENGRHLLRATNNGVTMIVDPRGAVTHRLPQFETAVLTGEARAMTGRTPFARYGSLPAIALAAMLAALALASRLPKKRRRGRPE